MGGSCPAHFTLFCIIRSAVACQAVIRQQVLLAADTAAVGFHGISGMGIALHGINVCTVHGVNQAGMADGFAVLYVEEYLIPRLGLGKQTAPELVIPAAVTAACADTEFVPILTAAEAEAFEQFLIQ